MAWELIVDKRINQDYTGPAERCTYTFSLTPEQIPGTRWAAQQVVDAHDAELALQGSKLLELKMWEDTTPIWTTDYFVEVVATASPLWWNLIIVGVLLILVLIAIFFIIQKVDDITEYIGEKAPLAIPLIALGGIALVTFGIVYLMKRRREAT